MRVTRGSRFGRGDRRQFRIGAQRIVRDHAIVGAVEARRMAQGDRLDRSRNLQRPRGRVRGGQACRWRRPSDRGGSVARRSSPAVSIIAWLREICTMRRSNLHEAAGDGEVRPGGLGRDVEQHQRAVAAPVRR